MRPGRAADHSSPSSAEVMEELNYNSTHPLGHAGPVKRSLYLLISNLCYVGPNFTSRPRYHALILGL